MKLTHSKGSVSISDEFIKSISSKEDLIEWGKVAHPDIPHSLLNDAFDSVHPPKVKKEKKGEL